MNAGKTYIIIVQSADKPLRYVERLNGIAPPTYGKDANAAARYSEADVWSVYKKVVLSLAEKEGKEPTAILRELKADKPILSDYSVEGWGEPRAAFYFGGKPTLLAYIAKSEKETLYAYKNLALKEFSGNAEFEAVNSCGSDLMQAFCRAAWKYAAEKIKAWLEKRSESGVRQNE